MQFQGMRFGVSLLRLASPLFALRRLGPSLASNVSFSCFMSVLGAICRCFTEMSQ